MKFKDYQTKKNRLTRLHPDFNLADDDDFFGFDHKEEAIPMSPAFKAAFALVAVGFAWFAYQAVKHIIINGITL